MADSLRSLPEPGHPPMLRGPSPSDPPRRGMEEKAACFRRQHGQALDWVLDVVRVNQKTAAEEMGYADHGVVGRWTSGAERFQLDKLRAALGEDFFAELLIALLQTCDAADVSTAVTVRRRRA